MTNKNIIILVLVIAVVGVGIYFLNQPSSVQESTSNNSAYNPATQGKVVFGVTDAATSMGSITSVIVTVDKVEIHNPINGWITVSNETKQYDLLALKQSGAVSLLANANVEAGTYDQVRLMVSKVVVTKNGVQQDAKLPSGELKIVGMVVVGADQTSSVVFDFQADKSLHMTGNGKFIFAPVIKVRKHRDTTVELKTNDEIRITGGKEDNDEDFGMDSKGEVKANFELKGNLNIDANDNISGEDESQEHNTQEKLKLNL